MLPRNLRLRGLIRAGADEVNGGVEVHGGTWRYQKDLERSKKKSDSKMTRAHRIHRCGTEAKRRRLCTQSIQVYLVFSDRCVIFALNDAWLHRETSQTQKSRHFLLHSSQSWKKHGAWHEPSPNVQNFRRVRLFCMFHWFCRVMFHNSSDLFIFLRVSSVLSRSGKRIESQMCCWPFGSGTRMDELVDELVDEPCVNAVSQVQSPQRVLGPWRFGHRHASVKIIEITRTQTEFLWFQWFQKEILL